MKLNEWTSKIVHETSLSWASWCSRSAVLGSLSALILKWSSASRMLVLFTKLPDTATLSCTFSTWGSDDEENSF